MNLGETYRGHGISFQYPGHWELTEEQGDETVTISVGDAGAFWSLTILNRRPHAEHVIEEAVKAFEDEYEEVDSYPLHARLAGESAQGKNLEFMAMELVNCVSLLSVEIGGRTLLVMSQVTDHEQDQFNPFFDAITASVTVAPDSEIIIS